MKTIREIFEKSNSPITKLVNKGKTSQQLELIFNMVINQDLAPYCRLANYQNSVLTINVPNSSIATKLRYIIPDLIKSLKVQTEFRTIKNIRYALDLAKMEPKSRKKTPKLIKLSRSNELLWKNVIAELQQRKRSKRKNIG